MALLVILASCAAPQTNWEISRRDLAIETANAQGNGTPLNRRAVLDYEYGRTLGVTCQFNDAERYLLMAYKLDLTIKGPYYKDLIELGELNLDQRKWNSAITYFSQAMPALDNLDAETTMPLTYADILDEYGIALEAANEPDGATMRQKAASIRKMHPAVVSIWLRTPYGTQCSD